MLQPKWLSCSHFGVGKHSGAIPGRPKFTQSVVEMFIAHREVTCPRSATLGKYGESRGRSSCNQSNLAMAFCVPDRNGYSRHPMNRTANPEMSVVVITPDDYATVRRIVSALRRQSVADRLEIVFVTPDPESVGPSADEVAAFQGWKAVATETTTSTAHMRAVGTRAATAPVVAFCEDHCFPSPGWAKALISRHVEDWAGVGAVVENANPRTAISWANLTIEYGDWLAPRAAGPVHHIGGHNSSYKRDLLLQYGNSLTARLEAESTLQWSLARQGHHFYLEPKARIFHTNMEMLGPSLRTQFNGGRLFAANRRKAWGLPQRALYIAGTPLIPAVRLMRCLGHLRRTGRTWMIPRVLPPLVAVLAASGLGEFFGYAIGPGRSAEFITEIEFHRDRFLRRGDSRRRSDAVSTI